MTEMQKIREAFRAGYWRQCGPANALEYDQIRKDEEAAWLEWSKSDALAPFKHEQRAREE